MKVVFHFASVLKGILMCAIMLVCIKSNGQSFEETYILREASNVTGRDVIDAIPYSINVVKEGIITVFIYTYYDGRYDRTLIDTFRFSSEYYKQQVESKVFKEVNMKQDVNEMLFTKDSKYASVEGYQIRQDIVTVKLFPSGSMIQLVRELNSDSLSSYIVLATYELVKLNVACSNGREMQSFNNNKAGSWKGILNYARRNKKDVILYLYSWKDRISRGMEQFTFASLNVIDSINDNFIFVKMPLQNVGGKVLGINSTRYREFVKKYHVTLLPTFLFFSSNGGIFHKASGWYGPSQFLDLLSKIKHPQYRNYSLVKKALSGKLDMAAYPELANRLRGEFNEKYLATQIAKYYYEKFLQRFSTNKFLTKSNLEFIAQYPDIIKSNDRLFDLCYKEPKVIDSIAQYVPSGLSTFVVDRVIRREVVNPFLEKARLSGDTVPEWEGLGFKLNKMYDHNLAEVYLLGEKVAWYWKNKNWQLTFQFLQSYLVNFGLDNLSPSYLNSCAWLVFKQSDSIKLLQDALIWADVAIRRAAQDQIAMFMDTRACLMYKLGWKSEAIEFLNKIMDLYPHTRDDYKRLIESMAKGEKVWITL